MKDTSPKNVNSYISFVKYVKSNEHNTNHCPSKTISGRCLLREIVIIHVLQAEVPVIQEQ
jgi:hypothetical protein